MKASESTVFVEAPARLHFGMLDIGGSFGRRFGGIGAALPAPSLLIEASRAREMLADGPDHRRALEFARRFLAHYGIDGGVQVRVRRALPKHAGLGSGTQLALAVGRALAELYRLPTDAASLAAATQRETRSGVGTWIFAHGGLVVEGGRRVGVPGPAPLLARLPIPDSWRCVIAIPRGEVGLNGAGEADAFARLEPSSHDAERIAHLVLLGLLPAVAEGDLRTFGAALTEIQRINGSWFAAAQGGVFAPGETAALVQLMASLGAAGVGQSSWGPTAYGIVEGDEASDALATHVRAVIPDGVVYVGRFANFGARVRRAPPLGGGGYLDVGSFLVGDESSTSSP